MAVGLKLQKESETLAGLRRSAASDRHDFGFLGLDELVDLGHEAVGQLLDVVAATALVIFRDFLGLRS
jgi:hypothetical protein